MRATMVQKDGEVVPFASINTSSWFILDGNKYEIFVKVTDDFEPGMNNVVAFNDDGECWFAQCTRETKVELIQVDIEYR